MTKTSKWRQKQTKLLSAAGMTEFDLNTSVIRSSDDSIRMGASNGSGMFADQIAVEFHIEGNQNYWHRGHFSIERARIFAFELLRRADYADKQKR